MIRECAEASLLAYEDADAVEAYAIKCGLQWYLFSKDDHQCIVLKGEKDIVAFRGTEASKLVFADFLTNLKSGQRDAVGRGKVHRGYYGAFFTLWPLLRHLVDDKCIFTGHSMGAAIATVAGATVKCDAVYSFCSPKVGDQEFADSYPAQMYRFISQNDMVPWYPADLPEWVHVGRPITLASDGHSMEGVVDVLI